MTTAAETRDSGVEKRINVIDAIIEFDAATLIEKYPRVSRDPDRPTKVDPASIYILTKNGQLSGSQGNRLNLRAGVGDVVRWRESTLSVNFDHAVLLYRHVGRRLLSIPTLLVNEEPLAEPDPGSPVFKGPAPQTVHSHSWASFITGTGSESWKLSFQILTRGTLAGYLCWDVDITVQQPTVP